MPGSPALSGQTQVLAKHGLAKMVLTCDLHAYKIHTQSINQIPTTSLLNVVYRAKTPPNEHRSVTQPIPAIRRVKNSFASCLLFYEGCREHPMGVTSF